MSKGTNVKGRKDPQGLIDLPCGDNERDLLRHDTAGHECKCLRRRLVQPMRVVD
jgi:hypothetical protein